MVEYAIEVLPSINAKRIVDGDRRARPDRDLDQPVRGTERRMDVGSTSLRRSRRLSWQALAWTIATSEPLSTSR